jgi:aldehyde:ferredoxin oxidoreductase
VGGYFGPYLKFSGFDAVEIQGKADREVLVVVDGDHSKVAILEADAGDSKNPDTYVVAERLTAEFGEVADKGKGSVSVVSSGSAASHTRWGCLNFSFYDKARKRARYKQAGRGGLGTVFRDKNLLALVCLRSAHGPFDNQPAAKDRLITCAKYHGGEIKELDPVQNRMREIGTAHLPSIMSEFDLLPTHNFKFGHTKYDQTLWGPVFERVYDRKMNDGCYYGCSVSCAHAISNYELQTGPYKGQFVHIDGPEYETIAGCGSNIGVFDWGPVAEINYYCDTYGIDTISFGTGMAFVMECYEAGILDKKKTGGLELTFGNWRGALEVMHQMSRGEGFGLVVGQGVRRMKKRFAEEYGADPGFLNDIGMESKGLEFSEYMTKESLAQQGGYGLTLKGPQHDEAWLIFLDMVHNYMPTFEQKAEALHWFPMFRTWFGLVGLCKLPWNDIVPADNKETKEPAKVIKHVESYAEFFSSVTGREVKADDLVPMSEAVYNFQRVFNVRLGKGRREHDAIPYRAMGPVTEEEFLSRQERYDKQLKEDVGFDPEGKSTAEKIAALRKFREDRYERLKDAVYERRGWTKDGVPKKETLARLGVDFPDVLEVVSKYPDT